MNKPSQERIERATDAFLAFMDKTAPQGYLREEWMSEITAALTADDSHLAAENERLRKLLGEALEALSNIAHKPKSEFEPMRGKVGYALDALTKIRAEWEGE